MRIYADSSFLVSFLYSPDTGHASARQAFQKNGGDVWLTSDWSRFETMNSLRQICLNGWEPADAEAIIRLFKQLHRIGPFEPVDTRMDEAAQECAQLSAAHGSRLRMRSADVLHVALLEQITPDIFLTRDKDQFALAKSRAFPAVLIS